jgi:hypothetical protein
MCSVYVDSSPDPQDDPKVETIVELLVRIWVSINDLPAASGGALFANVNG